MASLGKIALSLLSGTQETQLALASLNFDFSLVKIDAPAAFHGVGSALTKGRRQVAESGETHVTARKLGALFESLIPSTPRLFDAYGARASEIANEINTHHTKGIFSDFVGPDGTSIWAAATSGRAAIAVHLLACLLARIWQPAEAVSLWEDLINARRTQLLEEVSQDTFQASGYFASQVNIPREQLEKWDLSARSWLRHADKARDQQQTKVRFIIDDLNLPISSKSTPYESVIDVWTMALGGMEQLLAGRSQGVSGSSVTASTSVVLALSSWHLYPDISLSGGAPIMQNDSLVPRGSLITLNLSGNPSRKDTGIYWSLSLSHLRYYGDPIRKERSYATESSRIDFPGLLQVVLGSISAQWHSEGIVLQKVAQMMVALHQSATKLGRPHPEWLDMLHEAAEDFLKSREVWQDLNKKLFRLGREKGHAILCESHPAPVFGLSSFDVFMKAIKSPQRRLSILRKYANRWFPTASPNGVILRYRIPRESLDFLQPDHSKDSTIEETLTLRVPRIDAQENNNKTPPDPNVKVTSADQLASQNPGDVPTKSDASTIGQDTKEQPPIIANDLDQTNHAHDGMLDVIFNAHSVNDGDRQSRTSTGEDVTSTSSTMNASGGGPVNETTGSSHQTNIADAHVSDSGFGGSQHTFKSRIWKLGRTKGKGNRKSKKSASNAERRKLDVSSRESNSISHRTDADHDGALPKHSHDSASDHGEQSVTPELENLPKDEQEQLKYDVDDILDSRNFGRWKKLQYLVKYRESESLWQNWDMVLPGCDELVIAFHRANPVKPGPPKGYNLLDQVRLDGADAKLQRDFPKDAGTPDLGVLASEEAELLSAGSEFDEYFEHTVDAISRDQEQTSNASTASGTNFEMVVLTTALPQSESATNPRNCYVAWTGGDEKFALKDSVSELGAQTIWRQKSDITTEIHAQSWTVPSNKFDLEVPVRKPGREPKVSQVTYKKFLGDDEAGAIFVRDSLLAQHESDWNAPNWARLPRIKRTVDVVDILAALKDDDLDLQVWYENCHSIEDRFYQALFSLTQAWQLYKGFDGATISPEAIEQPITDRAWAKSIIERSKKKYRTARMTREEAFACVTNFESGEIDLAANKFSGVMAVSATDSIYVSARLLSDPADRHSAELIKRLTGNVARPGITIMIPPAEPMVMQPSVDSWRFIDRGEFNGQRDDDFAKTTLHLSFTDWSSPIDTGEAARGRRSVAAHIVETLVSVHDGGRWIAELDILSALSKGFAQPDHEYFYRPECHHHMDRDATSEEVGQELVTIRNWDEFLDRPRCPAIVMAHGNWEAKLAMASLGVRRGDRVFVNDVVCSQCLRDLFEVGGEEMGRKALVLV